MSASCLAVCAITSPLHLSSDRQYKCHIPICTSHLPAGALFLSPAKAPFSIPKKCLIETPKVPNLRLIPIFSTCNLVRIDCEFQDGVI